jgi:hypothetical protein
MLASLSTNYGKQKASYMHVNLPTFNTEVLKSLKNRAELSA